MSCKGRYALISLGCPKNLVDSERMAGLLRLDGFEMVPDAAAADFALINTCSFIADARKESHSAVREMIALKKQGALRGVIVAGCLAEREKDLLRNEYPDVDHLIGVFGRDEIAAAAQRIMTGLDEQRSIFRPAPARPLSDTDRLRITPAHLAYLKISEGCNRTCAFCAIPQMRGRHASKPIDDVLTEARQLAADGVRELVLVAQDLTYYGIDLDGRPRLAELVQRLSEIEGIAWIRLMYLYPVHLTDELIDVIAAGGKVLPYIDLPLQHANDEVLRRMRRPLGRAKTEALLARLRERVPGLVIRTTMIAGFPGETKEQFQEMLDFVRQQRFERLGAFAYSPEPGTAAIDLEGQLSDKVRTTRRDRVLAIQQEIAFAWNQAQVGKRLDVILDRCIPDQPDAYVGRSYADAPEIDGAVYVSGPGLSVGQIVPCEIVAAKGYDLVAAAVEPVSAE